MKLQGITNKGFERIARAVRGQETEYDDEPEELEGLPGFEDNPLNEELSMAMSQILSALDVIAAAVPKLKESDWDTLEYSYGSLLDAFVQNVIEDWRGFNTNVKDTHWFANR